MWSTILIGSLMALMTSVHGDIVVFTQETPHTIKAEFQDIPATFGIDIPLEGLRGLVVAGEPSDGCSPLNKPPVVENFTGNWIVLVARYNCSFETKVRNAQAAGYNCAIVHNVNSSDLETMSAKNPEGIDIPSVFVSDLAGLDLSEKYQYDSGCYIMINGDLPFNINTHLLLPFAIVVVLCLFVILIFMIVKCIKDRRRARRHRLPSRSLKKIPTCKFSKGDPYDTCAICLDDYQEGDRLRVLPCAHAYHAVCIDPWLTQNKRVCPVCKRRVFAAGERRRLDTDSDSTDTEPLLNESNTTQGGTFDEQQENPFVRAARFVSRLSRNRNDNTEEASPAETNEEQSSHHNEEQSSHDNEDPVVSDDRQPLLAAPPVVTVTSERRRRGRRARSASARASHDVDRTAHSINSEGRGEIGVAALPAPQASSTPRRMDL